jgi:hypothetical protein
MYLPSPIRGRGPLHHASIATTLNIYTHVVDASHRQAIEALERQLFPTVPKSEEADTVSASETVDGPETQEAPAAASERRREVARKPAHSEG